MAGRIREYVNTIRGLDISGAAAQAIARGSEFAGQMFRQERLGPSIARLGDAVADRRDQFIVAPEITKGAALFAEYQNKLTKEWNEIAAKADLNDTSIQQKFNTDRFEPTMNQFLEGFNTGEGKKWAQQQVQSFQRHMMDKTTGDMAVRAGQAALKNVDIFKDAQTSRVMNDPSSYQNAIDSVDSSIAAVIDNSPGIDVRTSAALKAKVAGDIKSELTKAYVFGIARVNPDRAEALIERGELKHISASDAKTLLNMIKVERRNQRADEELVRTRMERERRAAVEQRENEYIARLYPEDDKTPVTITNSEIARDPTLDTAAKRRLIQLVERELKPETDAKVSKYHANELFNRLYASDDDPNKITDLNPIIQAMGEGKLTKADYKWLREEFTQMRTPDGVRMSDRLKDFYAAVSPQIDQSVLGKLDTSGKIKLGEFKNYVREQLNFARQNKLDVSKLLTPGTPEYLGRPEVLKMFQPSLADRQRQMIESMGISAPNPAAIKPDQSRVPQSNVLPVPSEILRVHPDAKWDTDGNIVVQREVDTPTGRQKKWFVVKKKEQ